MGPYYLGALVTLLGPVKRVVGLSSQPQARRTIASGPRAGTAFDVEVPTHISGVLEHENGALSTMLMSFDVWAAQLPRIEIYGETGSLSVPDPNGFDGLVHVYEGSGRGPDQRGWTDVEVLGGFADAGRGFGLSDMVRGIASKTPFRATGELAYHVLEVMEGVLAAGSTGRAVDIASRCDRPAAVPAGARPQDP
jgi:predicted dehydrogenase